MILHDCKAPWAEDTSAILIKLLLLLLLFYYYYIIIIIILLLLLLLLTRHALHFVHRRLADLYLV